MNPALGSLPEKKRALPSIPPRKSSDAIRNSLGRPLPPSRRGGSPPVRGGGQPRGVGGQPRGRLLPPQLRNRSSTSIERQGLPQTKLRRSTESIQKRSGFIANQQSRGELPNATKFLGHTSLSLLKEGMNMSPAVLEIIENAVNSHIQKQKPSSILSKNETQFLINTIQNIQQFLQEQRYYQTILLTQSAIRRWLVFKKYSTLRNPKERKRILQLNEKFLDLFRTEKLYVKSLEDLIRVYVLPLRHSDIIEPQEGAYLFCNIEIVAEEHKKLCARLKGTQADWPFLGNVGEIFLDIKVLLSAVATYVGHFKTAINEIDRIKGEKPRFNQFLQQAENTAGYDLPTMLLLPVNRLSQYEIFFNNMAEFMKPGTVEREDIENATAVLAQSSIVVQQSLLASANTANMLKVTRKLRSDKGPLSVNTPGRIFVQEFIFKKHYVCIFSDAVLIANRAQKAKELHKFKVTWDINKTELISDAKNFELKMEKESFKFSVTTTEDKQQFIQCYNKVVEEVNRIKVFGVPLIETIIREERPNGIPYLIEILTDYILKNGPDVAGIFRVAGSSAEIKALKEAFNTGKQDPAYFKFGEKTLFSICDVLKLYFRELPEPMLGFNLYKPIVELMKTDMDDADRVKKIQEALLHWTPPFALKVLKYLMNFLNKIAKHNEQNKMTTNNIAIVFGPTLLWAEHNTLESAMDMPYINSAVKIVIENFEEILS